MLCPWTKGILAVRGGYGAMRLLEELAPLWEAFPPKPIIGFSDISALHLARYAATGVGGWHAPNLTSLSRLGPLGAGRALRAVFGGGREDWLFSRGGVLKTGASRGHLVGGNLSLFSQLYGTAFCPGTQGAIILLEDVNERPYALDRLLTGLRLRGAFRKAGGVVFGSLAEPGEEVQVGAVLRDFAETIDVPVLSGAPFGHGAQNSPWFYGEEAILEATPRGGSLRFVEGSGPAGARPRRIRKEPEAGAVKPVVGGPSALRPGRRQ
jgi:muramoyltetrapeptide carboxypeptidase